MCIRVGFIKKGRCFVPVIGCICIGECFSCRVIAMDVSPRVGIAMETQKKSDALSLNDRVVDSPEQLTNVLVSGVNHPFHPSGGVFGSALPDSELLRDGAGVVPGGGASSRFGFWW